MPIFSAGFRIGESRIITYYLLVAATGLSAPAHLNSESPDFLCRQLITYIGNKRALLDFIGLGVAEVKRRLKQPLLSSFDVFSGSGVVARFLKQHSNVLLVNDLELYAHVMNQCYLANPGELPLRELQSALADFHTQIQRRGLSSGFISEMYAPRDDQAIQPGERAFYTRRNAAFLDTARQFIEGLAPGLRPFLLAPLLAEASVHANTAGVFKGFYKDANTGLGRFGGRNQDALSRIQGEIKLNLPVQSRFTNQVRLYQADATSLVNQLPEVDLAYVDPPYNQHPYGSNYFMLNLLAAYQRPADVSLVSGIPRHWNRSVFNKPQLAERSFAELVAGLRAKFVLVSFNSEGFVRHESLVDILGALGRVCVWETPYNTFRASRNLDGRAKHVVEYLYLLEKS